MLDNLYPESIEESGNYLRIVLQKISKYKLPYNPITYALWYEYATGRNQQLLQDIQVLETEKKEIPFKLILHLFREYVADSQVLLAEEKGCEFQTILTEMITQLANTGSRLGTQGLTLETYAQELGHTTSMELISAIARNIILETKSIAAESQVLKNQMETTASEIISLKKQLEGIKQAAKTDMLTGLLNRRGFDEALKEALKNSDSCSQPLSIIMADIDHFKKVNDTHGHLIGDNVLKILSRLLKKQIKGRDIAARFGGRNSSLSFPRPLSKAPLWWPSRSGKPCRISGGPPKDQARPSAPLPSPLGWPSIKWVKPVNASLPGQIMLFTLPSKRAGTKPCRKWIWLLPDSLV